MSLLEKILHRLGSLFFQYPRIVKYRVLSNRKIIKNNRPLIHQPTLFTGLGRIYIGKKVRFGVFPSPYYYTGYIHVEVRKQESSIVVDDFVWFNNNCSLISEGPGIEIGKSCILGTQVEIYDSDFHDLNPRLRMGGGIPKMGKVKIGQNVFVASNVKILKGVSIGDNSVIGNNSIVVHNIPSNVVAAGNPARVVAKTLCV